MWFSTSVQIRHLRISLKLSWTAAASDMHRLKQVHTSRNELFGKQRRYTYSTSSNRRDISTRTHSHSVLRARQEENWKPKGAYWSEPPLHSCITFPHDKWVFNPLETYIAQHSYMYRCIHIYLYNIKTDTHTAGMWWEEDFEPDQQQAVLVCSEKYWSTEPLQGMNCSRRLSIWTQFLGTEEVVREGTNHKAKMNKGGWEWATHAVYRSYTHTHK